MSWRVANFWQVIYGQKWFKALAFCVSFEIFRATCTDFICLNVFGWRTKSACRSRVSDLQYKCAFLCAFVGRNKFLKSGYQFVFFSSVCGIFYVSVRRTESFLKRFRKCFPYFLIRKGTNLKFSKVRIAIAPNNKKL